MLQLMGFALGKSLRWCLQSMRQRVIINGLSSTPRRWTRKGEVAQRYPFEMSQLSVL